MLRVAILLALLRIFILILILILILLCIILFHIAVLGGAAAGPGTHERQKGKHDCDGEHACHRKQCRSHGPVMFFRRRSPWPKLSH